jgi:hypothetical protein
MKKSLNMAALVVMAAVAGLLVIPSVNAKISPLRLVDSEVVSLGRIYYGSSWAEATVTIKSYNYVPQGSGADCIKIWISGECNNRETRIDVHPMPCWNPFEDPHPPYKYTAYALVNCQVSYPYLGGPIDVKGPGAFSALIKAQVDMSVPGWEDGDVEYGYYDWYARLSILIYGAVDYEEVSLLWY